MLLTPSLLLLLPLGACNVSTDSNNQAVTVQYDRNTAENAAADVANTAHGIGAAIGNDVDRTANQVNNSGIVTHDNGGNRSSNAAENKQ